MMGLRWESMNTMTFGNMTHPSGVLMGSVNELRYRAYWAKIEMYILKKYFRPAKGFFQNGTIKFPDFVNPFTPPKYYEHVVHAYERSFTHLLLKYFKHSYILIHLHIFFYKTLVGGCYVCAKTTFFKH